MGERPATKAAYEAGEAIERAIEALLRPLLGLPAPAKVVNAEWSHRQVMVVALGWEGAARIRNRIARPQRPLLICRGADTMYAGNFFLGRDGCGVVFRGQWRRKQRADRVLPIGPRCALCNRRLTALVARREARDRATRAGVFAYDSYTVDTEARDRARARPSIIAYDNQTVEAETGYFWRDGYVWIGKCPVCGEERKDRHAWDVCRSCRQRASLS